MKVIFRTLVDSDKSKIIVLESRYSTEVRYLPRKEEYVLLNTVFYKVTGVSHDLDDDAVYIDMLPADND